MKLNNIYKILFITLSNIGDVILTLPVLSALKDNFPASEIDIVVGPRPKEIFIKDPTINKVFTYNKHAILKEKIGFIKRLRTEQYDLAIDMRGSLIPILIRAKNRTPLFSINKSSSRHKKLLHLDKLKKLGIEYKDHKNIYIDDEDRETVRKLLEGKGFKKDDLLIGINPLSRSPLKAWRIDGFIEVINSLLRERRFKIVLMGDATQVDLSSEITNAVRSDDLIDLTGKLNLNQLFSLIERLSLLLSCDSACMHIACDLGVSVVAIFGPTDPREYGPKGKDDIIIRKDLKCSPCKRAVCSFNHECMNKISAKEVLEAVKKLI